MLWGFVNGWPFVWVEGEAPMPKPRGGAGKVSLLLLACHWYLWWMSLRGGNANGHSRGGGLHKNSTSSVCTYVDCMCIVPWRFMSLADVCVPCSRKQQHKHVMSLNVTSLARHYVKKRYDVSWWVRFPAKSTTAGLTKDCRVGLRWHFRCRCPISKPRPFWGYSSNTTGVIFFLNFSVNPQNGLVWLLFVIWCFPDNFRSKNWSSSVRRESLPYMLSNRA